MIASAWRLRYDAETSCNKTREQVVKKMLGRMLGRTHSPPGPLGLSSEMSRTDIEDYYLRIITESLRRLLVAPDSVDVLIKRSGRGPNGEAGYAGCVRIVRWDPVVTPVLLQNMPVVDARVRRLAEASVILEHTYFAGMWFQASRAEGAPTSLTGIPAELLHQPGWTGS